MTNNRRQLLTTRRYTLDLLVILFGISSWLCINSTFVQLPLLVETAPEQWSLPSYFVIAIQLANLGPLIYTATQVLRPIKDSIFITGLLLIGVIGSISFGFVYKTTSYIAGSERSTLLLITVFGFALVGCTSSVLFMPYMGRFQEIYLITYLIGEGLSGFIPSTIALMQGVGGNAECILNNSTNTTYDRYYPPPRFSVQTFFGFIASLFIASSIAFILIDTLPTFKQQYCKVDIRSGNDYTYKPDDDDEESSKSINTEDKLSKWNYFYLMALMSVICFFTNAVFPSIQSYSCLPYGNVAYHWAVVMTAISNPVACFLAYFLPHKSLKQINFLTIPLIFLSIYAVSTSMMSPPPMIHNGWGKILVVST